MTDNVDFDVHVKKLLTASERTLDVMKSERLGPLRTIFNLAVTDRQMVAHQNKIASVLGLDVNTKDTYATWKAVIEKLKEMKNPSANRLEKIKDWQDRFWQRNDVKEIDHDSNPFHTFKNIRTLKNIAREFS